MPNRTHTLGEKIDEDLMDYQGKHEDGVALRELRKAAHAIGTALSQYAIPR